MIESVSEHPWFLDQVKAKDMTEKGKRWDKVLPLITTAS